MTTQVQHSLVPGRSSNVRTELPHKGKASAVMNNKIERKLENKTSEKSIRKSSKGKVVPASVTITIKDKRVGNGVRIAPKENAIPKQIYNGSDEKCFINPITNNELKAPDSIPSNTPDNEVTNNGVRKSDPSLPTPYVGVSTQTIKDDRNETVGNKQSNTRPVSVKNTTIMSTSATGSNKTGVNRQATSDSTQTKLIGTESKQGKNNKLADSKLHKISARKPNSQTGARKGTSLQSASRAANSEKMADRIRDSQTDKRPGTNVSSRKGDAVPASNGSRSTTPSSVTSSTSTQSFGDQDTTTIKSETKNKTLRYERKCVHSNKSLLPQSTKRVGSGVSLSSKSVGHGTNNDDVNHKDSSKLSQRPTRVKASIKRESKSSTLPVMKATVKKSLTWKNKNNDENTRNDRIANTNSTAENDSVTDVSEITRSAAPYAADPTVDATSSSMITGEINVTNASLQASKQMDTRSMQKLNGIVSAAKCKSNDGILTAKNKVTTVNKRDLNKSDTAGKTKGGKTIAKYSDKCANTRDNSDKHNHQRCDIRASRTDTCSNETLADCVKTRRAAETSSLRLVKTNRKTSSSDSSRTHLIAAPTYSSKENVPSVHSSNISKTENSRRNSNSSDTGSNFQTNGRHKNKNSTTLSGNNKARIPTATVKRAARIPINKKLERPVDKNVENKRVIIAPLAKSVTDRLTQLPSSVPTRLRNKRRNEVHPVAESTGLQHVRDKPAHVTLINSSNENETISTQISAETALQTANGSAIKTHTMSCDAEFEMLLEETETLSTCIGSENEIRIPPVQLSETQLCTCNMDNVFYSSNIRTCGTCCGEIHRENNQFPNLQECNIIDLSREYSSGNNYIPLDSVNGVNSADYCDQQVLKCSRKIDTSDNSADLLSLNCAENGFSDNGKCISIATDHAVNRQLESNLNLYADMYTGGSDLRSKVSRNGLSADVSVDHDNGVNGLEPALYSHSECEVQCNQSVSTCEDSSNSRSNTDVCTSVYDNHSDSVSGLLSANQLADYYNNEIRNNNDSVVRTHDNLLLEMSGSTQSYSVANACETVISSRENNSCEQTSVVNTTVACCLNIQHGPTGTQTNTESCSYCDNSTECAIDNAGQCDHDTNKNDMSSIETAYIDAVKCSDIIVRHKPLQNEIMIPENSPHYSDKTSSSTNGDCGNRGINIHDTIAPGAVPDSEQGITCSHTGPIPDGGDIPALGNAIPMDNTCDTPPANVCDVIFGDLNGPHATYNDIPSSYNNMKMDVIPVNIHSRDANTAGGISSDDTCTTHCMNYSVHTIDNESNQLLSDAVISSLQPSNISEYQQCFNTVPVNYAADSVDNEQSMLHIQTPISIPNRTDCIEHNDTELSDINRYVTENIKQSVTQSCTPVSNKLRNVPIGDGCVLKITDSDMYSKQRFACRTCVASDHMESVRFTDVSVKDLTLNKENIDREKIQTICYEDANENFMRMTNTNMNMNGLNTANITSHRVSNNTCVLKNLRKSDNYVETTVCTNTLDTISHCGVTNLQVQHSDNIFNESCDCLDHTNCEHAATCGNGIISSNQYVGDDTWSCKFGNILDKRKLDCMVISSDNGQRCSINPSLNNQANIHDECSTNVISETQTCIDYHKSALPTNVDTMYAAENNDVTSTVTQMMLTDSVPCSGERETLTSKSATQFAKDVFQTGNLAGKNTSCSDGNIDEMDTPNTGLLDSDSLISNNGTTSTCEKCDIGDYIRHLNNDSPLPDSSNRRASLVDSTMDSDSSCNDYSADVVAVNANTNTHSPDKYCIHANNVLESVNACPTCAKAIINEDIGEHLSVCEPAADCTSHISPDLTPGAVHVHGNELPTNDALSAGGALTTDGRSMQGDCNATCQNHILDASEIVTGKGDTSCTLQACDEDINLTSSDMNESINDRSCLTTPQMYTENSSDSGCMPDVDACGEMCNTEYVNKRLSNNSVDKLSTVEAGYATLQTRLALRSSEIISESIQNSGDMLSNEYTKTTRSLDVDELNSGITERASANDDSYCECNQNDKNLLNMSDAAKLQNLRDYMSMPDNSSNNTPAHICPSNMWHNRDDDYVDKSEYIANSGSDICNETANNGQLWGPIDEYTSAGIEADHVRCNAAADPKSRDKLVEFATSAIPVQAPDNLNCIHYTDQHRDGVVSVTNSINTLNVSTYRDNRKRTAACASNTCSTGMHSNCIMETAVKKLDTLCVEKEIMGERSCHYCCGDIPRETITSPALTPMLHSPDQQYSTVLDSSIVINNQNIHIFPSKLPDNDGMHLQPSDKQTPCDNIDVNFTQSTKYCVPTLAILSTHAHHALIAKLRGTHRDCYIKHKSRQAALECSASTCNEPNQDIQQLTCVRADSMTDAANICDHSFHSVCTNSEAVCDLSEITPAESSVHPRNSSPPPTSGEDKIHGGDKLMALSTVNIIGQQGSCEHQFPQDSTEPCDFNDSLIDKTSDRYEQHLPIRLPQDSTKTCFLADNGHVLPSVKSDIDLKSDDSLIIINKDNCFISGNDCLCESVPLSSCTSNSDGEDVLIHGADVNKAFTHGNSGNDVNTASSATDASVGKYSNEIAFGICDTSDNRSYDDEFNTIDYCELQNNTDVQCVQDCVDNADYEIVGQCNDVASNLEIYLNDVTDANCQFSEGNEISDILENNTICNVSNCERQQTQSETCDNDDVTARAIISGNELDNVPGVSYINLDKNCKGQLDEADVCLAADSKETDLDLILSPGACDILCNNSGTPQTCNSSCNTSANQTHQLCSRDDIQYISDTYTHTLETLTHVQIEDVVIPNSGSVSDESFFNGNIVDGNYRARTSSSGLTDPSDSTSIDEISYETDTDTPETDSCGQQTDYAFSSLLTHAGEALCERVRCAERADICGVYLTEGGEALCDTINTPSECSDIFDDISCSLADTGVPSVSGCDSNLDSCSISSFSAWPSNAGQCKSCSSLEGSTSIESFHDAVDDLNTSNSADDIFLSLSNESLEKQIGLQGNNVSYSGHTNNAGGIPCINSEQVNVDTSNQSHIDDDMERRRRRERTVVHTTIRSSTSTESRAFLNSTPSVLRDTRYLNSTPTESMNDKNSERYTNVSRSLEITRETDQFNGPITKECSTINDGSSCELNDANQNMREIRLGNDRQKINIDHIVCNEQSEQLPITKNTGSIIDQPVQRILSKTEDSQYGYSSSNSSGKSYSMTSNDNTTQCQHSVGETITSSTGQAVAISTETVAVVDVVGSQIEAVTNMRTVRRRRRFVQPIPIEINHNSDNINMKLTETKDGHDMCLEKCTGILHRDNTVITHTLGDKHEHVTLSNDPIHDLIESQTSECGDLQHSYDRNYADDICQSDKSNEQMHDFNTTKMVPNTSHEVNKVDSKINTETVDNGECVNIDACDDTDYIASVVESTIDTPITKSPSDLFTFDICSLSPTRKEYDTSDGMQCRDKANEIGKDCVPLELDSLSKDDVTHESILQQGNAERITNKQSIQQSKVEASSRSSQYKTNNINIGEPLSGKSESVKADTVETVIEESEPRNDGDITTIVDDTHTNTNELISITKQFEKSNDSVSKIEAKYEWGETSIANSNKANDRNSSAHGKDADISKNNTRRSSACPVISIAACEPGKTITPAWKTAIKKSQSFKIDRIQGKESTNNGEAHSWKSAIKKSQSFGNDTVHITEDVDHPTDTNVLDAIKKRKVADICKTFIRNTRSGAARSVKETESPVNSPVPQRKLMQWVNQCGKWQRIPVDELKNVTNTTNAVASTETTVNTNDVVVTDHSSMLCNANTSGLLSDSDTPSTNLDKSTIDSEIHVCISDTSRVIEDLATPVAAAEDNQSYLNINDIDEETVIGDNTVEDKSTGTAKIIEVTNVESNQANINKIQIEVPNIKENIGQDSHTNPSSDTGDGANDTTCIADNNAHMHASDGSGDENEDGALIDFIYDPTNSAITDENESTTTHECVDSGDEVVSNAIMTQESICIVDDYQPNIITDKYQTLGTKVNNTNTLSVPIDGDETTTTVTSSTDKCSNTIDIFTESSGLIIDKVSELIIHPHENTSNVSANNSIDIAEMFIETVDETINSNSIQISREQTCPVEITPESVSEGQTHSASLTNTGDAIEQESDHVTQSSDRVEAVEMHSHGITADQYKDADTAMLNVDDNVSMICRDPCRVPSDGGDVVSSLKEYESICSGDIDTTNVVAESTDSLVEAVPTEGHDETITAMSTLTEIIRDTSSESMIVNSGSISSTNTVSPPLSDVSKHRCPSLEYEETNTDFIGTNQCANTAVDMTDDDNITANVPSDPMVCTNSVSPTRPDVSVTRNGGTVICIKYENTGKDSTLSDQCDTVSDRTQFEDGTVTAESKTVICIDVISPHVADISADLHNDNIASEKHGTAQPDSIASHHCSTATDKATPKTIPCAGVVSPSISGVSSDICNETMTSTCENRSTGVIDSDKCDIVSEIENGAAIEISDTVSCRQVARREFLFGLRDNFNRRKPSSLLPTRQLDQPDVKTGAKRVNVQSDDNFDNKLSAASQHTHGTQYSTGGDTSKEDKTETVETPTHIPKLKAVKIQEEIFEGKPEYTKECNRFPLDVNSLEDTKEAIKAIQCQIEAKRKEIKQERQNTIKRHTITGASGKDELIKDLVSKIPALNIKRSQTVTGLKDFVNSTNRSMFYIGDKSTSSHEIRTLATSLTDDQKDVALVKNKSIEMKNSKRDSKCHTDKTKRQDNELQSPKSTGVIDLSQINGNINVRLPPKKGIEGHNHASNPGEIDYPVHHELATETRVIPRVQCAGSNQKAVPVEGPTPTILERGEVAQKEDTARRQLYAGGTLDRKKMLLSEIVEDVEDSSSDTSRGSNSKRTLTQSHTESRLKTPVKRSNKQRSLSLPTGTLAFGDARIVYKNGHFTIETMDGIEIDTTRPTELQQIGRQNYIDDNNMHTSPEPQSGLPREVIMNGFSERENTHRPIMRRQVGKSALMRNSSTDTVFKDETNLDVNRHKGDCRVPRTGQSYQDFSKSGLSKSANSSLSENRAFHKEEPSTRSLSNSCVPDRPSLEPEAKRVSQRARRTSSFRQAQQVGAIRLSGIEEDGVHENSRKRTESQTSVDSQSSDLDQSVLSQNAQNTTFFQKMLAKRKSLTDTLNISSFSKQNESAKDFFSKKMSLKGLFKKNKSDLPGATPVRPVSQDSCLDTPPIATFESGSDIGHVDSAPGSPFRSLARRHTSADLYAKPFCGSLDSSLNSETDSNCPTPTIQHTPIKKSFSTPSRDDDQISVTSTSTTSSVHSTQYPPLDQPHKPKTPKPIGASPRRNPSSSSQYSRSNSQNRDISRSVNSLESDTCSYDSHSINSSINSEILQMLKQESEHLTPTQYRQRKLSDNMCNYENNTDNFQHSSTSLGSLNKLSTANESSSDARRQRFEREVNLLKKSYEKLAILAQAEITSSNSNDSGIQHDVSVHSSSESIKGTPEVQVKLRRRKSASPKPDRPKSEAGVRWADLDETDYEAPGSPVQMRKRDPGYRPRARPVSDIEDNIQLFDELFMEVLEDFDTEGSSFLSDRMKAFGSEINLQPYCSLRNLYEMRRRDHDSSKPKNRRMSTPHPIKSRLQRLPKKFVKQVPLVRSSSLPESLEKAHKRRKLHHLLDFHMDTLSRHLDGDECLSDDSDLSFDHISLQEKSMSVRSSHSQLTSMDEEEDNLTYAEALWDHITMDPEELGFRAGDLIDVVDMADKDWWFGEIEDREGWFPAAFVRLRVNQETLEDDLEVTLREDHSMSPKVRRISTLNKDQARTNVVNEIINAEREYVKHLKDVVEGYIQHARKRAEMFSQERISLIFGNVEVIYAFARKFLSRLELCIDVCPHLSEIGQVFIDNERGFEIYSDYCNNHPSACEELKELYRNAKYRHFFEACRLLQELVEIPLEGFLLTPVQKICKYPLQLAELLKYTPPDHEDYAKVKAALGSMRKIATLINERKRKMESIEKIAAWQQTVVDWEDDELLQRSSELIYSGDVNKVNSAGWSQERYFFLFDHQLIYCKKELLKRHVFSYKGRIDLDHCDVVPIHDGKDTQYNVTVKNAWKLHETHKDKWYLLYAKTAAGRDRWLKALTDERRQVKEDLENDFCVPYHWKQTVMNKVLSQSSLKDKQNSSRNLSHTQSLDLYKDFPSHATLPRTRRQTNHNQEKKKSWFSFGGGKKSKR